MYFNRFTDDVMFSHNVPYGVWHWQYLCESCARATSHKFPTYLSDDGAPHCLTLTLYTMAANGTHRGISDNVMQAVPSLVESRSEVFRLQLPCCICYDGTLPWDCPMLICLSHSDLSLIPNLHDTTGCTTSLTTGCIV